MRLEGKKEGKKVSWKPGNMLYPLPAVLVSVGDSKGRYNLVTVAWTGTVCTNPAMVYISLRPERYSYSILQDAGEFVLNLTNQELAFATDWCGVKSGRDVDKWKTCGLTRGKANHLKYTPIVMESPVSIECKVIKSEALGSHTMFLAQVMGVQVDADLLDDKGRFCLNASGLLTYSHGSYLEVGKEIGTFGWSVKRKKKSKK